MQGSIDFSGVLSGSVTGEGGGGAVPVITANATVDSNTGTPSCDVSRTGTDLNPNFTFSFKNIKGATGDAGAPGQNGTDGTDGVSPGVSISNITNGHRVTITDATHPSGQVFDVMNGSDGQDGTNGTNGTNGVSPAVTITDITDGHRVTITDATHPSGQSFDVMDGEKGDTGNTGPQGQTGPVGPGVNPGGTTGQILYKASNADYDTAWGDIPSYTASQITYDPTGRTYISDTDVQGALDEVDGELSTLNNSLAQLGALALPIPNTNKFTCSVYNCTASNVFTDDLNYIINGNYLILCGRARITVSSRTGGNCGLKITIPNSKTITLSNKCTNYVSPSYYSDGFRNGEATMIEFDSGTNDYFYIRASESYANVTTKILCFTIPMTVIKLDS